MMAGTVSCTELKAVCEAGEPEIIDVRTPAEFAEVHARGAHNFPLDSLDPARLMATRSGHAGAPLYIICRSGARGARACDIFRQAGFDDVVNIEGGTMAWEQAGLPVVRSGRRTMSLERQVRLVAGTIVMAGGVLAVTSDPWFGLVPACVGGGLALAAICDSCAMGMLLARMPWNRA